MSDDTQSAYPEKGGYDLDLLGFLGNALGLGEAARLVNDALQSAGVKTQTINREVPGLAEVDYPFDHAHIDDLKDYKPAPLFLCCVNGEHIPSLIEPMGEDLFFDRKIVSIWYWETANLPESVLEALPYLDEVWLSSEFIADAVRRAAPKDLIVRTFRHPIRIPPEQLELPESNRFDFEGRYVFLFSFDFNSSYRRKNPHAVCEAFAKAFPEPQEGGPLCVVKSINGGNLQRVPFELLKSCWEHRPDIIFLDEFLSYEDRERLFRRADCYVSLHRAEGLGLTLMEAMALGKPCISTNYSGNLAFMNQENSYLVDYELTPVGHADLHYPAEELWAEPNTDQAAEAMRACYERTPEAIAKATKGKQDILAHHSIEQAGKALREVLQEALASPPRKRTRPSQENTPEQSGSHQQPKKGVDHGAKVRSSLEELRALELELEQIAKNKVVKSRRLAHLSLKSSLKSRKGIEHAMKQSKQENKALRARIQGLEGLSHRLDFLERNLEELMRHVIKQNKPTDK